MEPTQADTTASQDDNVKLLSSATASPKERSTPEVFGEQLANEVLPTLAVTDETSMVELITDNEITINEIAPVTNRIGQMSPILSTARIHLLAADSFDSNDDSESVQLEKPTGTNNKTTEIVDLAADNKDSNKDELGNNNTGKELLVAHDSLSFSGRALSTENSSKIENEMLQKLDSDNQEGGVGASQTQLLHGDNKRTMIETGTQTNLSGGMIDISGNIDNTMFINSTEGVLQTPTSRLANESQPNNGRRSRTIFFDPESITTTVSSPRILHLPNTEIRTRPTRRAFHSRNHQNFAGEFDREQARLNAEHRGIQNLLFQFCILMILAVFVFGVAAVLSLISKL